MNNALCAGACWSVGSKHRITCPLCSASKGKSCEAKVAKQRIAWHRINNYVNWYLVYAIVRDSELFTTPFPRANILRLASMLTAQGLLH